MPATLVTILGVTGPTVTSMLGRLETHGLVKRTGRSVALTEHGRSHAEAIIRRSRLLETFLVDILDVPWDEAPAEADLLEHSVSERLLSRIDGLLGHPTIDPHGDPIPRPGAEHVETWGQCLTAAPIGSTFVVKRVRHDDPGALALLADNGVVPGATCTVHARTPYGGQVTLDIAGRRVEVGPLALAGVFGSPAPEATQSPGP